jgi:hypothetical protein
MFPPIRPKPIIPSCMMFPLKKAVSTIPEYKCIDKYACVTAVFMEEARAQSLARLWPVA